MASNGITTIQFTEFSVAALIRIELERKSMVYSERNETNPAFSEAWFD
jgi:hypothetical protein